MCFIFNFLLFSIVLVLIKCNLYNIPDPDCSGSFGSCTDRDLAMLGYASIKKLHEKIDDNQDGTIDIKESQGFIEDELQLKQDTTRHDKFHKLDSSITIDELWKIWISSQPYKWSTDDTISWFYNDLALGKYSDNLKRNKIDGRSLPRLAANENSFLTKVLKIKDFRDRNRITLKATDLVLFDQQDASISLSSKDLIFVLIFVLLTSIFGYVYRKNLYAQNEIDSLRKKYENMLHEKSVDSNNKKDELKIVENSEQKAVFMSRLSVVQKEAERFKKSRLGSVNYIQRLRFAEKELEKVRQELSQRELQINMIKNDPPKELIDLLNATYQSEKSSLDFRFEYIEKERNKCLNELNKLTKTNSSVLNMFWIAHSSVVEQINIKLEFIHKQIKNLNIAKTEWNWRWSQIDTLTSKNINEMNVDTNKELEK